MLRKSEVDDVSGSVFRETDMKTRAAAAALIHELAHVVSALGGFKSRSAASDADFPLRR